MLRKTLCHTLLGLGLLTGMVDGADAVTTLAPSRLATSPVTTLAAGTQALVYTTHPTFRSTDPRMTLAVDPAMLTSTDPSLASLDPQVVLANPASSLTATPVASGPGWVRSRISGVPLPELVLNGAPVPADHFITVYGVQGIVNFDLYTMTGIFAPPFSDKLKQRLWADALSKQTDSVRTYVLYEPALLLALGRDRIVNPGLYAGYSSQFPYLNTVIDYAVDNLQVALCGPTLTLYGFEMSPGCGGSGGSGGGGPLDWLGDLVENAEDWLGCAAYEEKEKDWATTATAQVVNVTTGPFQTIFPITQVFDGTLNYSARITSATNASKGVSVAAHGRVRYAEAFCVPLWFRPVDLHLAADAAIETLLKVDGTILSTLSATPLSTTEGSLAVPVFVTAFAIGPVPVLVFVEVVGEVGLETTIASAHPVHVSGALRSAAGVTFQIACDAAGCSGESVAGAPSAFAAEPLTSNLTTNGRATIRPYIWPSLRAVVFVGPLPLFGQLGPRVSATMDIWGQAGPCGDGDGDGVEEHTTALAIDIDTPILDFYVKYGLYQIPGVPWPFDGLAQGDAVLATLMHSHFGFYDVTPGGRSRAFSPLVTGPASPTAGLPATYQVKMRPCYPYPDRVAGLIYWGDGTVNGWEGSPQSGTAVTKTWAAPGTYSVVAVPTDDDHGMGRQWDETAGAYRTARSVAVAQDTAAPVIGNVSATPDAITLAFRQTTTIAFTVSDAVSASCSVRVQISYGRMAYTANLGTLRCRGNAASVTWSGRDSSGNPFPAGSHVYRIYATDAAGNTSVASGTITVR